MLPLFEREDMTLQEALDSIDHLKPNQYSEIDKIGWISDVDGRIYKEILSHYKDTEEEWDIYDENTNTSIQLLAKEPYESIYVFYMSAMIDYWNGEFTRYNNSIQQFNDTYKSFADEYRKNHVSKGLSKFRY